MEKELIQPVIPTLGKHIIIELSGCKENSINEIVSVEQTMLEAAKQANATVIKSVFHKFSPVGVSGVVVISESHLSIHTWPELGYCAIDIYTCGKTTKPFKACYYLAKKFGAKKIKATYILRGIENKPKNFYTHKIKIIKTSKIFSKSILKSKNGKNNKNKMLTLVGER